MRHREARIAEERREEPETIGRRKQPRHARTPFTESRTLKLADCPDPPREPTHSAISEMSEMSAMLPDDPDETIPDTPETPKGRIERWQSKLLDLSLRNRLLNFRATSQTVPCRVPDVALLEDALAAGKQFKIVSLMDEEPTDGHRISAEERETMLSDAVRDAYERGQVSIPLDRRETDKRLLTLFRKAKSDLAEGGTNTLFLAAGSLRWRRTGETRSYRAPLLLIPIKLERRSARSELRIVHHEDGVSFNATLLEFLKRDFDLALPELEGELPKDENGIDVPLIFQTMRDRVRHARELEVTEEMAISTFSFSKYLMWKDLVDRTEKLRDNRLVAHLVDNPSKAFDTDAEADAIEPNQLDRRLEPHQLITPLPADSSQLAAVVAAMHGHDFVLIGPPGTGKSQTISNIICQCLAQRKTILFVSEKAAALDVVHRRLEAHGLGDAVLELHSNKTDRKRVLAQLGRGWDRAAGQSEQEWLRINRNLKIRRDQLNTYVDAIHRKGTQGFSIFDALSWTTRQPEQPETPNPNLAHGDAKDARDARNPPILDTPSRTTQRTDTFTLSFPDRDAHDAEGFRALEDLANETARIHATLSESDIPEMTLVAARDWSFAWENDFLKATGQLRQAADRVLSRGQSLLGRLLGHRATDAEPSMTADRMARLDKLAERTDKGAQDLRRVPNTSPSELWVALDTFNDLVEQLRTAKAKLGASYPEEHIPYIAPEDLERDWRRANAIPWPISSMRRRKIRKILQGYTQGGTADPESDLPRLRRIRETLDTLKTHPITPIARSDRSTEHATRLCEQAIGLRGSLKALSKDVRDEATFEAAQDELVTGPDQGPLRNDLTAWREARDTLIETTRMFEAFEGTIPDDMPITDVIRELDLILDHRHHLDTWTRWLKIRARAEAAGLGDLADRLEAGTIKEPMDQAFRRAYAQWWLPLALASEPLNRFNHWEHEDSIRAFHELDARAKELAPDEIMRRIDHQLPARDRVPRNSELGKLRHQLGLKRPSMTVRTLLGNLTEALPYLTPCVLMSPLSIAQYLPAGQASFDLVIFDEASQITTWDAVGAIARARQSIIVGDPKQLPPTSFFGRSNDDEESDLLLADMPSILDEVATAGVPIRQLNWHYRSRKEALIAFSNRHYYNGQLVTFPAPTAEARAVELHKIEGIYDRGSTRTNQKEADTVVAMIDRRLSEWTRHPEQDRPTLGVITFNSQQQTLILDLLDELRRRRNDLEWFFEESREEPLIVKNLENIQGDERDVILFSMTFGPDAEGKLPMNFGPLNQSGGERRLNVAVTRARQELHVVASITEDRIDLTRTKATGAEHLKTFLAYAEHGPTALPVGEDGKTEKAIASQSTASTFEETVAETLRNEGWEVHTRIGISDSHIDMAVVDPDRTDDYLAGIECDGVAYHRSATACDRDKVRQTALEGLGWTILRIWSVDWLRDPESATRRICEKLDKRLADARRRRATLQVEAERVERAGLPTREQDARPQREPRQTSNPGIPSRTSFGTPLPAKLNQHARQWASYLDRTDVLIVDTETTGLDAHAEVVEIAVLDTCGARRAHALVLPSGPITKDASKIHGITKRWLRSQGARDWPHVWATIGPILAKARLCLAWNAPFDQRVIKQSCERHDLPTSNTPWGDLLEDYRRIRDESRQKGRHTLEATARREAVQVENRSHRAEQDCVTVLKILRTIGRQARDET